jgi:hypothetical protein
MWGKGHGADAGRVIGNVFLKTAYFGFGFFAQPVLICILACDRTKLHSTKYVHYGIEVLTAVIASHTHNRVSCAISIPPSASLPIFSA